MACRTGVITNQDIPHNPRGKIFLLEGTLAPVCFFDRWGTWHCGHDHGDHPPVPLQDAYHWMRGWTAQATI
jgi:hypothetical protein